jgi:hypothetical protein
MTLYGGSSTENVLGSRKCCWINKNIMQPAETLAKVWASRYKCG